MKLIAREPTPEMIEAMHERGATLTGMFQAAYDAAPEMKQEPVGIDWPDYHYEAMGCGLEDIGIKDKYDAMRYGWDQAIERCAERIPEKLFEFPPDAQAEIAKRDKRVKELEGKCKASFDKRGELTRKIAGFSELTDLMQSSLEGDTLRISELLEQNEKQAAEIARLKSVIGKCKDVVQNDYTDFSSYFVARREALAEIKEIEHE